MVWGCIKSMWTPGRIPCFHSNSQVNNSSFTPGHSLPFAHPPHDASSAGAHQHNIVSLLFLLSIFFLSIYANISGFRRSASQLNTRENCRARVGFVRQIVSKIPSKIARANGTLHRNKALLTHLEVKLEALMLKKVAFDWLAMHFPGKKLQISPAISQDVTNRRFAKFASSRTKQKSV